jgi:hypothetical protein
LTNRLPYKVMWTRSGLMGNHVASYGSEGAAQKAIEERWAPRYAEVVPWVDGWLIVSGPGVDREFAVGTGNKKGQPRPKFTQVA